VWVAAVTLMVVQGGTGGKVARWQVAYGSTWHFQGRKFNFELRFLFISFFSFYWRATTFTLVNKFMLVCRNVLRFFFFFFIYLFFLYRFLTEINVAVNKRSEDKLTNKHHDV